MIWLNRSCRVIFWTAVGVGTVLVAAPVGGEGLRNPFLRSENRGGGEPPPGEKREGGAAEAPRVTGIFVAGEERWVVAEGRVVRPGEEVRGWRLTQVAPAAVEWVGEGEKRVTVRLVEPLPREEGR
ncbi:MAG: hypothetical protein N2557_07095 [Hydrogenophilus sp.]|nr:hypothetical protein [Hydrogenophilus sp.]